MHVVGALLVGSITGLGVGTINNMMVGATPVGWMKDPAYLVATIAAGILGFYAWPLVERRWSAGEPRSAVETTGPSELQYGLETVGLGALAVIGEQQGVVRGLNPLVSASLGVTVALGGVMRDLMCQRGIRLGGLDDDRKPRVPERDRRSHHERSQHRPEGRSSSNLKFPKN